MIPVSEQETVIQFNREGKTCKVWTSDSTMITKLDKLCKTAPDYYKQIKDTKTRDGEPAGKFYEIADKKLVSLRSTKVSRVLTEEQRKEMAERLRSAKHKNA